MEGDAGASRLNPSDTDQASTADVGADQPSTEITAEDLDQLTEAKTEDSSESESSADQASAEANTDDSSESEGPADQAGTEEKAEDSEASAEDAAELATDERNPSRLGRGWFVGITAALLVLAVGVGAWGYFVALRSHQESQAIARHDAAAVQAAKDCVAATQAPDVGAMVASAQKIIDCGTGAFRSQAILYSSLLVEAYQAANAHVQVSHIRAAVERNNPDGSVDVLVPLRVKVSNSATQNQEAGYRLRVTMALDEGQYRIAKIDQVAK
jgi:Mce-associated membrane protein